MSTSETKNLPVRVAPDGQVKVVVCNNPFNTKGHDIFYHELDNGVFFADLMPSDLDDKYIVTSLNGEIVTEEERETKTIQSGDSAIIFQLPAGGDDDSGKTLMRLILLIVFVSRSSSVTISPFRLVTIYLSSKSGGIKSAKKTPLLSS